MPKLGADHVRGDPIPTIVSFFTDANWRKAHWRFASVALESKSGFLRGVSLPRPKLWAASPWGAGWDGALNMMHPRPAQRADDLDVEQPVVADLCRMIWMVFGSAGLLLSTAAVWAQPAGVVSVVDLVFFAIVLGTILANFLDHRLSRSANGERASMTVSYRYAIAVTVAAFLMWGAAHLSQLGR